MIKFKIDGLKELEKQLNKLDAKMGLQTMRSAGRKAMQPVLQDAKAGANEDTGALRRAIKMRTRKRLKKRRVIDIDVGLVRKKIGKKEGGGNIWDKDKRLPHKATAQEYGTDGDRKQKAKPFLRPALAKNADRVLKTYRTELAKAIKQVAKRSG